MAIKSLKQFVACVMAAKITVWSNWKAVLIRLTSQHRWVTSWIRHCNIVFRFTLDVPTNYITQNTTRTTLLGKFISCTEVKSMCPILYGCMRNIKPKGISDRRRERQHKNTTSNGKNYCAEMQRRDNHPPVMRCIKRNQMKFQKETRWNSKKK